MKNKIKLILAFVFVCLTVNNQAQVKNKSKSKGKISISNFRVADVSDSKISVTVDYNYVGQTGKEFLIRAYPQDGEGKSMSRNIKTNMIPLKNGNNSASFTITKRSPGKDFKSESIKICMLKFKQFIFCEEYSLSKLWNESKTTAITKIISFTSNDNLVEKGEAVTLSWQTENASRVMLSRSGTSDAHNVPTSGSKTVLIDKTVTYVLMATPLGSKGPTAVISEVIKIEVANKPVFGGFYATRTTIRRGIKSELTWKFYNADAVTLNGESVPALGDKIVSPKRTTKYTLIAQTGDKIVEENLVVYVTPFGAPKLAPPFYSLEICGKIDLGEDYARCVSSDGPFSTGDKIYIIARFKNLPKGKHSVKRITYRSFYGKDKWTKAHQEESSFNNTAKEVGFITFPIVNLGDGAKKLKIILNDKQNTSSEIIYCIDCSRMWD